MLTIQHTNNTHAVEQQWEFYSALTLIIDIQGRPTVCNALPHVFPLYFPDGDYHRISRRTDGVSGKGYVWTIFRLVIRMR